jgi:hypothetical protein
MPPFGDPFQSFTGSFGGIITFHWAPEPIIVARQLEAAADKLNNMQLPLMAARDLGIIDVRENFEGEHDPDGTPWAPWSQSYVDSGPPGPPLRILHLTGDLEGSSTSPVAWPVTAREVFFSFGALPEYGIYHQSGASRQSAGKGQSRESNIQASRELSSPGMDYFIGSNDLPARPFAGISVETQFKIIDVFDAWFGGIVGLAVGAGGRVQTRGPGGRFGPAIG